MAKKSGIKVWEIDLSKYPITYEDGRKDVFDVRESICRMLFHPDLRSTPDEMFQHKDVADRIRAAEGDTVLLDNEQMAMVRKGYDCMRGGPEYQVEFLRRIIGAKQRDIEEV